MTASTKRLMVIAAHPQDPFERAGGAVAKHLVQGDQAMLVTLTSGVVTHAFNLFPATGEDKLRDIDHIKALKRQEFETAATILGAQTRWYDFMESPMLFGLEEYSAVVNLIREYRPDAVLCPHPVEFGRQDHMDCGRITIAAVDYARADGFPSPLAPHTVRNVFMFYYQDFRSEQVTGNPRHAPEIIVDITDVVDKKRAAMAVFGRTQTKQDEDYERKLDRFLASIDGNVGYLHGFGYAEQFSRLNPERVQYLPIV